MSVPELNNDSILLSCQKRYIEKYFSIMKKIFLALSFLTCLACETLLEENPEAFIDPDNFYNTLGEAKAATSAVKDMLPSIYNVFGIPAFANGSTHNTQALPRPAELEPPASARLRATVPVSVDVCVYGGTAAGITAAIQAAQMGRSVIIVEPGKHIGGMSVEGLGGTDINNHAGFENDAAVGGLALEFYRAIAKHYGISDWENKRGDPAVWRFESHVADSIFEAWVARHNIPVYYDSRLKLGSDAIEKSGTRVDRITMENGLVVEARVFIDATIEGDLLHYAGVNTVIGREANNVYGETKNGIRGSNTYRQFEVRVDPYIRPGDPDSGLIPTIQDEPLGIPGTGDDRIQAYCFRVCLTQDRDNKVAFTRPEGYDPDQYEIYLRYLNAGGKLYQPRANIPNGKTDLGAWHDLSHNLYGMNHKYPAGDYATRGRIYQDHLNFTSGLFYFLANDPAVPDYVRQQWNKWGLCKDEFTDNQHWPRQFYVRDARRMISDYVITEHHTRRNNKAPVRDPVGVAYWPPDVHHVRRIVRDHAAYNEGFVFGGDDWAPFGISYQAMVPKKAEAINLMTPTCISSSHVAYGAIRLEWTFMVLGQAAGTAAALAIQNNCDVQDVSYQQLKKRLIRDKQVLSLE